MELQSREHERTSRYLARRECAAMCAGRQKCDCAARRMKGAIELNECEERTMDVDSIRPLISILIWGGLFFVMMRFGCGAHMMGGHGRHSGHSGTEDAAGTEIKDPVCGMVIDRQNSTAASNYRGKAYHFCSASCRDKFEQAPEKYAGVARVGTAPQGGHHHG